MSSGAILWQGRDMVGWIFHSRVSLDEQMIMRYVKDQEKVDFEQGKLVGQYVPDVRPRLLTSASF